MKLLAFAAGFVLVGVIVAQRAWPNRGAALTAALRGDGLTPVRVRVHNYLSARYLTPDGVWN